MALLWVAGVMNLLWVAAIATFVIVEKYCRSWALVGRVAGACSCWQASCCSRADVADIGAFAKRVRKRRDAAPAFRASSQGAMFFPRLPQWEFSRLIATHPQAVACHGP